MVTSKPGQKSEQSSAAWTDPELARGWRVVRFLPIFEWLPRYGRDAIAGDLMAGAVVAIMLVPQSMAYAMIAGLPLQVGLYASILPLLLYALLGSSRVPQPIEVPPNIEAKQIILPFSKRFSISFNRS